MSIGTLVVLFVSISIRMSFTDLFIVVFVAECTEKVDHFFSLIVMKLTQIVDKGLIRIYTKFGENIDQKSCFDGIRGSIFQDY